MEDNNKNHNIWNAKMKLYKGNKPVQMDTTKLKGTYQIESTENYTEITTEHTADIVELKKQGFKVLG